MEAGSALDLILSGDRALFAIVRLSLMVTLSATLLAALFGMPLGAIVALTRFPGRDAVIVILNGLMGLPPVVVGLLVFLILSRSGPLGFLGHPVHADRDGRRAGRADRTDHRGAHAAAHRGPVGGVSRRVDCNGGRPASAGADVAVGCAVLARHDPARRLRPGGGRGRAR